jgi:acyl-CoA thioesterase-1
VLHRCHPLPARKAGSPQNRKAILWGAPGAPIPDQVRGRLSPLQGEVVRATSDHPPASGEDFIRLPSPLSAIWREGAVVARLAAIATVVAGLTMLPAQAAEAPIHLVALGDSLVAGYGLRASEAFPAALQRALAAKGLAVEIANAGVSGDTASGGLARLDWSVPDGTDAVILELGANDALRGFDPAITRNALDTILRRLKARNIPVLLAGMLAPRNLGADYASAFDAIYPDLAKQYGAILYPFFLTGVVGNPKLNQADGLHPTAEGVGIIVNAILPKVEELIAQVARTKATPKPITAPR